MNNFDLRAHLIQQEDRKSIHDWKFICPWLKNYLNLVSKKWAWPCELFIQICMTENYFYSCLNLVKIKYAWLKIIFIRASILARLKCCIQCVEALWEWKKSCIQRVEASWEWKKSTRTIKINTQQLSKSSQNKSNNNWKGKLYKQTHYY